MDDVVGLEDRVLQQHALSAEVVAGGGALVLMRVLDAVGDELGECLHRDAARDLAGFVAAHAVGDHDEARLEIGTDRVLVVRAHHPLVAVPDEIQLAFIAHARRPFLS
jgi:hypothetical protein